MSGELFNDSVNAITLTNNVDPFAHFLDSLPKWDRKPRPWLLDCFTVDSEHVELAEWASRSIPLTAVTRSLTRDVERIKVDETAILIGPHDIGKSTVLSQLFPTDYQEWFGDRLDFGDNDQKQVESLLGKVVN